jgi:hypothetical protein
MNIFKVYVFRFHFLLLGLVLLNFAVCLLSDWSLNYDLVFLLKLLVYLSGIVLFAFSVKPFKKIAVYYFYYVLTTLSVGLFTLTQNFIFGLLTFVLIIPIYRNDTKYQSETINLRNVNGGFLSACCLYEVTEPQLLLFEKNIGKVHIWQEVDFKKSTLTIEGDSLKIENDSVMRVGIR